MIAPAIKAAPLHPRARFRRCGTGCLLPGNVLPKTVSASQGHGNGRLYRSAEKGMGAEILRLRLRMTIISLSS